MSKSLFSDLRRDIDRMLCAFGLSQDDVRRTHLGDSREREVRDAEDTAWTDESDREPTDRDAKQRGEAPVSVLRAQERDSAGRRRVLPLARMPLVRLAQRPSRGLRFPAKGRLARYVHARRPGWRLLRPLLPNLIGPFFRGDPR